MILVDYVCGDCAVVHEKWTPSPPAGTDVCPSCGRAARRRWTPVRLGGSVAPPAAAPPSRSGPMCRRYPQVPGLCHMSEDAGRMWVAKYLQDHRTVDVELAKQEARAAEKPPVLADAITHQHFAGNAAAVGGA